MINLTLEQMHYILVKTIGQPQVNRFASLVNAFNSTHELNRFGTVERIGMFLQTQGNTYCIRFHTDAHKTMFVIRFSEYLK